ncbi:arylamine N-acetyltransferase family protein [Streptomyces albireticuli]|uniref:Acetyltransferase n=1 Tax=Streptomyces albireticuli TaxID=1940 RepID=A0A2A2DD10_9ACTN|nr:arylamine N-acetyltransferase [Streptomyces albireticuli]MCD9145575.1 arylamine N-acetyltransferase [Streptomyces albireticuli]MCD9165135.1 arylamine N-acetyltransferase [Streptomyces albireticuli]MCD9195664.1 arylamine N-acetyltransferase [Streptomyces albireticuli]PAU49327.1 acetyltransferase [Streptomyces albireticuli]
MSESMWGGKELDLGAYLARIGLEGPVRADLATLRAVHRGHVAAFPFENLEILLDRPVRLEVKALQDKMVAQARGGYCYEQNLLLAAALERIGFSFTGLGARIRMGGDKLRPVTHMALKVAADGGEWLCDVGFGGEGLLEPLAFHDGVPVRQGGWTFASGPRPDGTRVLRSLHPDGWFDLYAIGPEERFPVDYAVMNHYISTHPHSPFVSRVVVQQTTAEARWNLVGSVFSTARADGSQEQREIPADELVELLAREFRIELSEADSERLLGAYSSGT